MEMVLAAAAAGGRSTQLLHLDPPFFPPFFHCELLKAALDNLLPQSTHCRCCAAIVIQPRGGGGERLCFSAACPPRAAAGPRAAAMRDAPDILQELTVGKFLKS